MTKTRIMIPHGSTLGIGTLDENGEANDGEIEFEFTDTFIEVRTDWPDDTGRTGILYRCDYLPVFMGPDPTLAAALQIYGPKPSRDADPVTAYVTQWEDPPTVVIQFVDIQTSDVRVEGDANSATVVAAVLENLGYSVEILRHARRLPDTQT